MIILGIETSCDETSAAIVHADEKANYVSLLSNVIATSLELHTKTGGIIPEQAAREQIKYIIPVINQALQEADKQIEEIDAFAVTYGPGLIGSLLVGVETVRTLAYLYDKPLIPVNHMIGHLYANWIKVKSKEQREEIKENFSALSSSPSATITFPAIGLVVSGGHTDLLLLKSHQDIHVLGGTRDDAAGECFDKCARLLGYPYPGGPKIAELATNGNSNSFPFPRPMLGSADFEFSFSGLKTAFLNTTKQHFPILRNAKAEERVGWQEIVLNTAVSKKEKQLVYDLCASLQRAVISVLVKKTIKAVQKYHAASLLISGGVAANTLLREALETEIQRLDFPVMLSVPPKRLCTDNAAMIAAAAYFNPHPLPWKEVTANPELYY